MFRRVLVLTQLASVLLVASAAAQPQISMSSSVVAPDESVAVTIAGQPGAYYALLGSSVNNGVSFAGVRLKLGRDVVNLATGMLGGDGQATVSIVPPFLGTVLDRYYVQAVTSFSPQFDPLEASAVVVREPTKNGGSAMGAAGQPPDCAPFLFNRLSTPRAPIAAWPCGPGQG